MQKYFEKIKKRLEEQKEKSAYITDGIANRRIYDNGIKNAIEIVNQVAEECKDRIFINGQCCWQSCACTEKCQECNRYTLSDADIDWYESIEDWDDEFGKDTNVGNRKLLDSLHEKILKSKFAEEVTEEEIEALVNAIGSDINVPSNDGCIPLSKVAFDRMIARMESESERDIYEEESLFINVRDAARIVHEIAKEYSNSEKPNMSENLTSSDEFCEWRLCDEEANVYDTACGNSEMLFDGSPIDNNYSFCSYCGKKIKLLECTKCKWYWQNNDTENECSGYPTTCCEYVETAPYQPKGENNERSRSM